MIEGKNCLDEVVRLALADKTKVDTKGPIPLGPRENQMDPTSLAQLDAQNAARGVLTNLAEQRSLNRERALTEAELFLLLRTIS